MSIGRNATCGVLISSACSRDGEAGAVVAEHEPADPVAAKVVGQQVPLPRLGQVPAADDLEPAVLGAARIEPAQQRTASGAVA